MLQNQCKALNPAVSPGQKGRQITDQAPQRKQQRGVRLNVKVEFDALTKSIRRLIAAQRQRMIPLKLIKMRQQLGREAFGQPVTGQFQHLLQAAQAHALQTLDQLARQAAARHRQTLQLGR